MAVAFSRYVDGTSSLTTTAAVNLSACSAGDFALVLISRSNVAEPSETPSDWALLDAHSSTYRVMLYWKLLEVDDLGSLTWTFGSTARVLVHAFVYTGVDGSEAPAYSKGNFGTGSAQTLDLGTLTSDEAWLAVLASCYSTSSKTYDVSSWEDPSWTERRDHGHTEPDHWQLGADTNGGWGGGKFAPAADVAYISADATYRGGFIVELKAAGGSVSGRPFTADLCGGFDDYMTGGAS